MANFKVFGKLNISEGPTNKLVKNDKKHANMIIALFSTPCGTSWTRMLVGMQINGFIMKNKPTCTQFKPNSPALIANTGSKKATKKYPSVPLSPAKTNFGYLNSSRAPIFGTF